MEAVEHCGSRRYHRSPRYGDVSPSLVTAMGRRRDPGFQYYACPREMTLLIQQYFVSDGAGFDAAKNSTEHFLIVGNAWLRLAPMTHRFNEMIQDRNA